ncbi:MAG TPA: type II 3-dehydroquinate dehydratase, partial [Pontimonas sp.]|nr:type II 3-dehydroquinate dehydratase [Pontimonas sp.]
MTRVLVLNGPNLGRLGTREPEIYGSQTLADIEASLSKSLPSGVELDFRQTDDEATLIGWLHEAADALSPVILNPAAFTHYSYAVRDACQMVTGAGAVL